MNDRTNKENRMRLRLTGEAEEIVMHRVFDEMQVGLRVGAHELLDPRADDDQVTRAAQHRQLGRPPNGCAQPLF